MWCCKFKSGSDNLANDAENLQTGAENFRWITIIIIIMITIIIIIIVIIIIIIVIITIVIM